MLRSRVAVKSLMYDEKIHVLVPSGTSVMVFTSEGGMRIAVRESHNNEGLQVVVICSAAFSAICWAACSAVMLPLGIDSGTTAGNLTAVREPSALRMPISIVLMVQGF